MAPAGVLWVGKAAQGDGPMLAHKLTENHFPRTSSLPGPINAPVSFHSCPHKTPWSPDTLPSGIGELLLLAQLLLLLFQLCYWLTAGRDGEGP